MALNEGEIIFNNRSSLFNYGLKMEDYPVIPSLNEEYDTTKVDGRDGELHINNGTYPNRSIPIKFDILGDDYDYNFDLVDDWLSNIKDNRLFIGRLDRCFKVIKVIKGDTQKEFRTIGNITITFLCEPYRYDPVETVLKMDITGDLQGFTINNTGHFPIKPIVTIEGSGYLTLSSDSVNELYIKGLSYPSITVDSENLSCSNTNYNKDLTNITSGKYPYFKVGNSNLTLRLSVLIINGNPTGTATKMTVTYSQRYR